MPISGSPLRAPLGFAAVIAAAALVTGCGSSGTAQSSAAAAATGGASQSASAASTASASAASGGSNGSSTPSDSNGLSNATFSNDSSDTGFDQTLGGPALAKMLVVPTGYTSAQEQGASGAPTSHPGKTSLAQCTDLRDQTAFTLTTDYRAAYAQNAFSNNSSHLVVNVNVSSFAAGDAAKQMAEINQLLTQCSSYKTTDSDGNPITMSVSTSYPTELDEEIDVQMKSSESGYIDDEFLLVRVGRLVFALSQNSVNSTPADLSAIAHDYVVALS